MSIYISYDTDTDIEVDNYENIIKKVISAALDFVGCPYEAEVNVTIGDNEMIKEINREYRNIDNETDVLSFPAIEFSNEPDFENIDDIYFNPDTGELMLGDMIISAEKVIEQSLEYGHSKTRELAFLTAHSMLHLFGYDHEKEDEAHIMEEAQEMILTKLGYTRDV